MQNSHLSAEALWRYKADLQIHAKPTPNVNRMFVHAHFKPSHLNSLKYFIIRLGFT